MRLTIIAIAVLTSVAPAAAGIYKCSAKYSSGKTITIGISIPENQGIGSVILIQRSDDAKPRLVNKNKGLVLEGEIEYTDYDSLRTKREPLFVTKSQTLEGSIAPPIYAFYTDVGRVVTIKIDYQYQHGFLIPDKPKILTYYDPRYAYNELALGTCL